MRALKKALEVYFLLKSPDIPIFRSILERVLIGSNPTNGSPDALIHS
jgi:hypothetical protein